MMDAIRAPSGAAASFAADMTADAAGAGAGAADAFDAIFASVSPAPAPAATLVPGTLPPGPIADLPTGDATPDSAEPGQDARHDPAVAASDPLVAAAASDANRTAGSGVTMPPVSVAVATSDVGPTLDPGATVAVGPVAPPAAMPIDPGGPPVAMPVDRPHASAGTTANTVAPAASDRSAKGETMRAADGDDAPVVRRPTRRRSPDGQGGPIPIVLYAQPSAEPTAPTGDRSGDRRAPGPLAREATVSVADRSGMATAATGSGADRAATAPAVSGSTAPVATSGDTAAAQSAPALSALLVAAGLTTAPAVDPVVARPATLAVAVAAPTEATLQPTVSGATAAMPSTMTMLGVRGDADRGTAPAAAIPTPVAAAASAAPLPPPAVSRTQPGIAATADASRVGAPPAMPTPPLPDATTVAERAPAIPDPADADSGARATTDGSPRVAVAAAAPAAIAVAAPIAPRAATPAPAATDIQPARGSRGRAADRQRDADPVASATPAAVAPAAPATDPTPGAGTALAAGGADRAIAVARHSAWADGLARDIASAGGVGGTTRFTVAPAALGTVSVELTRSADGAAVRLVASSDAARDALDAARPQLVAEARAQGLHIRDAQVDLAGSSGGGTHRDPAPHQPIVAPAEPSRPAGVADTNSLTTGAYGGASGGEAGRQAQQQARQPAAPPQVGNATASRRPTASDAITAAPRRAADGRYA